MIKLYSHRCNVCGFVWVETAPREVCAGRGCTDITVTVLP